MTHFDLKKSNQKTLNKSILSTIGALCTSFSLAFVTLGVAGVFASGAAMAQATQPEEIVKQAVNEAITMLRKEKLQANQIKKIQELVDKKIIPYTDLEVTTKAIMGPFWDKANEAQRKEVMSLFKVTLIETYAGALTKVGNQEIKFLPTRYLPTDTKVLVKTQIIDGGDTKSIDYRLYKTANTWKVYDMNVLGVGLISTYKADFQEVLNKKGVDGLIADLKAQTK